MKSFLQTTEWLKFQEKTGHKVWRFDDGNIQANIIKFSLPFGKSYLYIPHGPEINFQNIRSGIKNELAGFISYLKELAKVEKAIFIKIEPMNDTVMELLHTRGMRRSSKQIQPYRTVVLDLNLPEEHLLGKMHPKTRYNIKVAEKHGIQIRKGDDVETFWNLMRKTTERDGFSSHPKKYYSELISSFRGKSEIKTELVLAYHEERPVAGALILIYGSTGYYLHGASDHEYRAMMAPYGLHWDIIKYLKGRGIEHYDFWGIDSKKWPGVTRFKLGWGGETKEYPGSFDLIISSIWYFIYLFFRKLKS